LPKQNNKRQYTDSSFVLDYLCNKLLTLAGLVDFTTNGILIFPWQGLMFTDLPLNPGSEYNIHSPAFASNFASPLP